LDKKKKKKKKLINCPKRHIPYKFAKNEM